MLHSSPARFARTSLFIVAAWSIAAASVSAQPSRAVLEARTPLSSAQRDAAYALVANKVAFHATRSRNARPAPALETVVAASGAPGTRRVSPAALSQQNVQSFAQEQKCEAGDPSVPPYIDRLKGKIGSGGYLVIEGGCFGNAGSVELVGDFPGGRLALQNQSWAHSAITAGIPSVSGVYQQMVRIRVVRGNVLSNEVTHDFVPEWEDRIAPVTMVANLACPFDPGGCVNASGRHFSRTSDFTKTAPNGAAYTLTGDDRWEVKPPRGSSVDSLDWTTNSGYTTLGDDFMTGSPADLVFTMHWQNALVGTTSPWYPGTSDKLMAAVYGMTVHVVGPKGTWQ